MKVTAQRIPCRAAVCSSTMLTDDQQAIPNAWLLLCNKCSSGDVERLLARNAMNMLSMHEIRMKHDADFPARFRLDASPFVIAGLSMHIMLSRADILL